MIILEEELFEELFLNLLNQKHFYVNFFLFLYFFSPHKPHKYSIVVGKASKNLALKALIEVYGGLTVKKLNKKGFKVGANNKKFFINKTFF
jgi:hypothetical protein